MTAPEPSAAPSRGCDACRVIGPLLTAPGTSGRSWRCDCGEVWSPEATVVSSDGPDVVVSAARNPQQDAEGPNP